MNPKDHQEAIIDAIKLRAGIVKNPLALHPTAQSLIDDGARLLPALVNIFGAHAVRPGGMNPHAAFAAGLSSPDFSGALSDGMRSVAVNKASEHAKHRAFCDIRELRDFKDHTFPSVDTDIGLAEGNELGEFGNAVEVSVADGLTARVKNYGRNIVISRRVLVNDDVEVIAGLFANAGAATGRLEAGLVYSLIESNPTLSDSESMFHTNHGNIQSAILSSISLSAAMGQLRIMLTPAGQMADLEASVLVVAPDLELTAMKLVHEAAAPIKVIASPWLPTGRWYLMASPAQSPVVALLYLKGSRGGVTVGPRKTKLQVDGVTLGIRFDVGVVPVGRVGIVKGGL